MEPGSAPPLVATASTPDPQALMAAYPFASATPSAHVSRHLNSLTGASSVPSFVTHGQQQYQMDPQARQYAARALQMEAQQGAYQGYAPPTRWAPSEYAAPVETYAQYSYGGNQNYGHVAHQQQAQYPPSAQASSQNQSSQYQYSSSQQYSQSAVYPTENQRSASQHPHQQASSSHPQSNLKPQSQSQLYTQHQYPGQASRNSLATSVTSSGSTGVALNSAQAQYQGSFPVQQQQSKQAVYPSQGSTSYTGNASYPSQSNTTSTYPSQAHTASSYSQPPSASSSHPTQSNPAALTYSRSGPSDSISSNFLAPLASHQFAPRLSQPVSTLPRHSSDSRVLYSADGRKGYAIEPHVAYTSDGRQLHSNAGGDYSANAGKSYPIGLGRAQSMGSGARYPPQSVQRSSSNQYTPGFQPGLGLDHGQEARVSGQHATGGGARQEQSQVGYSNQMQRQASGSYSGVHQPQARDEHQGEYQKLSQSHQHQARAQAEGPSGLNQRQQQARGVQQARQPQVSQSAWPGHAANDSQSIQQSQHNYQVQPAQDAQYAQLAKSHSQSQFAGHYAQPQSQVHASREQLQPQGPQSQQPTSGTRRAQPRPSLSQQPYGAQAHGQAQVQSYVPQAVQQESAQFVGDSRFPARTQGHSQSPQVQQQTFQPPSRSQLQPQPTQAQTQPQLETTQFQPQAMPLPQPARTQSQSQSRAIYAPLAGRPSRGRGMGRPIAGSQRVLQGGPPRILTPVQMAQDQNGMQAQQMMQGAQVQGAQVQRPIHVAPNRQMQPPSGYGIQAPMRAQTQQVGQAYVGQQQLRTSVVNPSTTHQTPGQPQQREGTANQQESAGDTSMEYVGTTPQPAQPLAANVYNSTAPDANTAYPDSPPPPYEPLMRDRARGPEDGLAQGQGQGQVQEVNGYATQLQQLSLRSNPPTPQPPDLRPEQTNRIPQAQPQAIQQQQTVLPPPAPAPRKHNVQDSAAHFDAFLSAGASAAALQKSKPTQPMQPAPSKKTIPPPRLPAPTKTPSTSSSSSMQHPRLSPVVELSQRSAFMTPRKGKKWREPRKDIGTDSPPKRDTDSPDPTSLSPSKRKREVEAETGGRTVKRMMSISIDNTQTPTAASQTYDATVRTPGSSMRAPGKFSMTPSRMKLVVEMPSRRRMGGGSPEGGVYSSPDKPRLAAGGMGTGKRDAHLEKLCSLIEDVIEAEDTLDPESAAENGGPADWFSPMTSDWSAPLLASNVIGRLTQLASRRGLRLSEVDTGNLTRILKILGRSVAKGEDLDPFGSLFGGIGPGTAAKPKAKGKKKAKGTAEEEAETEEPKEEVELGEEDFARLTRSLEVAKEAAVAADCVVAILSADRLPKQMYSEDLITSCLGAVKNQLSSIIYPYVETASDVHGHSPPLLLHVAQGTSSLASVHRSLLGEIFRTLNAALPRVTALANHGVSETMVIQAAFIGIGPFFVVEGTPEKSSKANAAEKKNGARFHVLDALGGSTSMRGLRLAALGLVRALFAGYESQRAWIVEEILGSLIKLPDMKLKAGQFKLRDGATIHVVSALLFQLVQTSAHDVRIHAQKLARKRREALADANTASFVENGKAPLLDEHDLEETHLYLNGLESATKTAKTIVFFLTQRSGKNKNTKSTNEAEYRGIFDNLIQDILVVLNWPEWPAANLLMSIVCKFMLSALEDVKSSTDSAAKNIALDHLGEIATRLRETHLTLQLPFTTAVKPLEEIVASCDLKALDDLIGAHSDVYAHLSKRASDDQAYDSARELTAATWAQELATCLRQCDSILSKVHEDEEMEETTDANLRELAIKLKAALRNVWSEGVNDMFEAGTDAEVKRVDDLAERFSGTQSLRNAFEPILGAILMALDAPAVFMRTKALRALGLIVTKDSSILKQANVRRAIESHLMDSSPAVRDAAVELIGKYLVLSPELVDDYYPQIANRIADTGLAVRKRVIKLLKSLYGLTDNHTRRVDICTKLVLRLLDEDDGIKDLAISSIEELWFSDVNETNAGRRGAVRDTNAASNQMTSKISVIMGVNANFRDRQSPLEDMLHEIIAKKSDKDAGPTVQRYVDVCDALTDSLVDAQEIPGFSVVNCIRTVHVFTAAHPTVMSTRKAVILLPYLKSGSTADDQAIADYLLKIFRSCIPRMPTGTSKFGTELQQTLEPMVIKPSGAAGVAALPETVACLCAVVHHLTHDYQRLVALLRSCNGRLVQVLAKQNQPTAQEIATLSILALIVSLLGEHSDFDKIREEQPTLKPSIDSIKETSIAEYIYGLIHRLYQRFNDQLLRGRLLQCFGFLFRAHPTLLTHDDSAEMMDAIFASPQEDAQARLLKIMQDFLLSEASKHSHSATSNKPKKGGAVDMDELIGNTDGFADSGVSSAIIQRYLTQILSSALSSNRFIQAPAVDILSFTVRQGLAHPLQCFPIIVALETSHDNSLSSRASNLHTLLHNKHASLLNSRYLESVGRSLEYQKQLQPGSWKGYRLSPHPTALLHRWYSLVKEKRQPKLDFLKSFLRAFDVDVAVLSCSQEHFDLVRYIAENMSAFDYKTQEEILTVIRHLTHVLSVAGMHVVEILHQERRAQETSDSAMEVDAPPVASSDGLARARVVTIISIILVLKAHLKHLYGITEEKASRWVPGKKTAAGDKPAVVRHDKPISWERVTFATRTAQTGEDVKVQEEQLLELWAEDGVTAEPDDFGD